MRALFSVEMRRILARRLVRLSALVIFVAIAFAGVLTFIKARTVGVPGLREVFLGTTGPLIVLLAVAGASFAGAEWHAGTMTSLLTWEPRRVRVLLAKILAAAAFGVVAFVLVQSALMVSLLPAALAKGVGGNIDATWLRGIADVVLRGAAMGGLIAVIGFSLASLGRNTAAAIGVLFAYVAVAEGLVRGLKPAWQVWLLSDNLASFVTGKALFFPGRSLAGIGLTVLAYAGGLAAAAIAAFRLRDLT